MIVIYHSADLDGYCSAAICKKKYPDAILIGYNYGQPFPWDQIPEYSPVTMVDVSLPMPEMVRLAIWSQDFVWIDHHKSAIQAYEESLVEYPHWPNDHNFVAILEDGIAACEGAWKYLFPLHEGHEMPAAVKLLGMYDTWRQSDTFDWDKEILPFQYGMRLRTNSAETFPEHLFNVALGRVEHAICSETLELVIDRGHTILEYQRQQFEIAMHGSFECDFLGYKAIMANVRGAGSLAFESVLKPEHQIMVGFGYTGSKWSFSLRTDKEDVDVSAIAKQFGGGGHAKASGFAVNSLQELLPHIKCEAFTKSFA